MAVLRWFAASELGGRARSGSGFTSTLALQETEIPVTMKKKRTTVASLEKMLAILAKRAATSSRVDLLEQRLLNLSGRMENQRLELNELDKYREALGPLWKTQEGHRVPITLLSTNHLQRLSSGIWVKDPLTMLAIKRELKRRSIDESWRVKECLFELKDKKCEEFQFNNGADLEDEEDLEVEISSAPIKDLRAIRVGGITVRLPQEPEVDLVAQSHDPNHWREIRRMQAKQRAEHQSKWMTHLAIALVGAVAGLVLGIFS